MNWEADELFFMSLHCMLHYYTLEALHFTHVRAICIQLLDCIVESEPGNESSRKIHATSKPGNEASRKGSCSQ